MSKILISISSVLVALVITEVYLRYGASHSLLPTNQSWKSVVEYAPSVFSRHVLKAESSLISRDSKTFWQVNSKGYRGVEFDESPQEGVKRIMVYGGSAVFDPIAGRGEDWPHKIAEILNEQSSTKFEAINAGVPGHASFESLGRLFAEGHRFKPDYVLLYHGWNDIKHFFDKQSLLRSLKPWKPSYDPLRTPHGALDGFLTKHFYLYYLLRSSYYLYSLEEKNEGRVFADLKPDPVQVAATHQFELTLRMFVHLVREIGAEPVFVTQARLVHSSNTEEEKAKIRYEFVGRSHDSLVSAFAALDRILSNVANDQHVWVIDASKEMSAKLEYFEDHVHLSQHGTKRLAVLVADWFREHSGAVQPLSGGDIN